LESQEKKTAGGRGVSGHSANETFGAEPSKKTKKPLTWMALKSGVAGWRGGRCEDYCLQGKKKKGQ